MGKRTRYFLDEKGGYKLPASLSKNQLEYFADYFISQGMKEVSSQEWRDAKKKFLENPEYNYIRRNNVKS